MARPFTRAAGSQPSAGAVVCTGRTDLFRGALGERLARRFPQVTECHEIDAVPVAPARQPSVILVGAGADDPDAALRAVRALRDRDPRATIVLVTADGSEALAVAALRAGLRDYFTIPREAEALLDRIAELRPEAGTDAREAGPPLVGETAVIRQLRRSITQLAANELSVVITGETGTGKEVVAERLHAESARRDRPFVAVNCAAIPDTLVESELFGYERGAFTGAAGSREGQLQQAHRGTIFFDEIGDMGAHAQAKILRAVERREVVRLGGTRAIPIDTRVIAATNQDLDRAMNEGRFRSDLYFRLNVARIHIPPLRERPDDIPRLIEHYATRATHRAGFGAVFTQEALDLLKAYDWPGNVRELKNLVDLAVTNHQRGVIGVAELPERCRLRLAHSAAGAERQRLLEVLAETHWNKSKAAARLHWSRMTLYRKLAKHRLLASTGSE
jgi:DNA-binding NtrC family response regulator